MSCILLSIALLLVHRANSAIIHCNSFFDVLQDVFQALPAFPAHFHSLILMWHKKNKGKFLNKAKQSQAEAAQSQQQQQQQQHK